MHGAIKRSQAIPIHHVSLRNESFECFLSKYPKKVYKNGEIILFQDEIPEKVYVIESGEARSYVIDPSGFEKSISFHAKDESLPIGYAFGLVDKAQFFYEAYGGDCDVRLVPRRDIVDHLESNTASLRHVFVASTKQLLVAMSHIEALEQSSALKKVALSLLQLPIEMGLYDCPKKAKYILSITQQEIANSIGLTRETTSVELKKLQKMNLIDYTRNNYTIYTNRLKKYLKAES